MDRVATSSTASVVAVSSSEIDPVPELDDEAGAGRDPIANDYSTRLWSAARRVGIRFPYPVAYEIKREDPLEQGRADAPRLAKALAEVPGFRRLRSEERAAIASASEIVLYLADETVLEQGAEHDALFVVLAGTARLDRSVEIEGGDAEALARLDRGEVFGEDALSRGQQSPLRVVADSDLELARVPVSALDEILASNAPVASEFARLIDLRKELAET